MNLEFLKLTLVGKTIFLQQPRPQHVLKVPQERTEERPPHQDPQQPELERVPGVRKIPEGPELGPLVRLPLLPVHSLDFRELDSGLRRFREPEGVHLSAGRSQWTGSLHLGHQRLVCPLVQIRLAFCLSLATIEMIDTSFAKKN